MVWYVKNSVLHPRQAKGSGFGHWIYTSQTSGCDHNGTRHWIWCWPSIVHAGATVAMTPEFVSLEEPDQNTVLLTDRAT